MDKNLSKLIKILASVQVALTAMFHFGQFFFFFKVNEKKNMLKWFLLVICKENTLSGTTNLLIRNHPTLCFFD